MTGRLWEALSLPVTVLVLSLTFSFFSIWLHSSRHQRSWEEHSEQDLRRIQEAFSDELGVLCRRLHALATQIEQEKRPRLTIRARLGQVAAEHPFLGEVTWIDSAGRTDQENSVTEPGKDTRLPAALEPFSFDLIRGESDFRILVPVGTSDGKRGLLVACVPMREVLDHSIAPDISSNYFIALSWNKGRSYLGNSRALQDRTQVKKGALASPLLDLNVSLLSHQLSRIQLERIPLMALSIFLALGLAVQRASDLIAKLHASVHEVKSAHPVPVNVFDVLQAALKQVTPELELARRNRGIAIVIECAVSEGDEVLATETLLQTIFQKLLQNSIEALPNGGTITCISRPAGSFTEIETTDDGIGIDEEMLERAFEPLFTTKAQIGKGLSLAFIRSTVSSWNGTVTLSSLPKIGTTVSLRIPSAPDEICA